MKKCASCGFNNSDARDRCLKCSASLNTQPVPDGSHVADRPDGRTPLMAHVRRALYWLGRKLAMQLPTSAPHRFPWIAAWLSLIPGGGQLYNFQKAKALIFVFVYAVLGFLVAYTFFIPASDIFCLIFVFWVFYAMADGFVTAARINGDPWRFRHLVAVWFAFMFMLGAVLFLGQLGGHGLFYLTTVRADTLAPGIQRGDKLFILCGTVYRKLPSPGHVVYYNPARYYQDMQMGDDYIVNEQSSFEVVTASEGQTVECDAQGVIKVNGQPVPPNLLPTHPNGMPHEFKYTVAKDSVGMLMSHPVVDNGLFGGAILAGSANSPRQAQAQGRHIRDLDKASQAKRIAGWGIAEDGEINGVVMFCYYPPQRRRCFGTGGLWKTFPNDYPEPRE